MHYKMNAKAFFRCFSNIGILVLFSKEKPYFNILDDIALLFIGEVNKYNFKDIDEIADELYPKFKGVSREQLKADVIEFFDALVAEEFLERSPELEVAKGKAEQTINDTTLPSAQDFLAKFLRKEPHLLSLQIEITNKCNERCIHCYIPHEIKNHDMPKTMFENIVRQVRETKTIYNVNLSGGEALLHPDFFEFIDLLSKEDLHICILTNATNITNKHIKLFKENNIKVLVSLYSLNREHHDYITQVKGSFEKTYNNVIKMLENDIDLEINCPILNQNKDDIDTLLTWANEKNINVRYDTCIIAKENGSIDNLSNRTTIKDFKKSFARNFELSKNVKENLLSPNFNKKVEAALKDRYLCGVGSSSLCVDTFGNVQPCPGFATTCGNINDNTIENIFLNSPELKKIRSITVDDLQKCKSCEDRPFCKICLTKNYNESPSRNYLEVQPYFCELARLNKEDILEFRKENMAN